MARVEIYDTTLRDGAQGEGISFSVEQPVFGFIDKSHSTFTNPFFYGIAVR
jgi:hypothetical protein